VSTLTPISKSSCAHLVNELLLRQEQIAFAYRAESSEENYYCDYTVAFTDTRLIILKTFEYPRHNENSNQKVDSSIFSYTQLQAFSVLRTDHKESDNGLELWFDGTGKVELLFAGSVDLKELCRFIGDKTP
jgi:hypothetical protein